MRFKIPCQLTAALLLVASMAYPGNKALAQRYYFYSSGYYEPATVIEVGASLGGVNAMTDVGGSKKGIANTGFMNDFTLRKTNFTGGLYATATYNDFIALRLSVNAGRVEAADSNLKGTTNKFAEGRYVRNLSFRTSLLEFAAVVEIHPLMMFSYSERDPPLLSPYLFGGISILKFTPRAGYNGQWYDLAPLRLEGQGFAEYPDRKPYKTTSYGIPFGVGLRYELSRLVNLRIELTKHILFTDYLDDVSQENWVDPNLFAKYLTPGQAALAVQLYNRSETINPPRNTRPRGKSNSNDSYWDAVIKIGINLNRIGR